LKEIWLSYSIKIIIHSPTKKKKKKAERKTNTTTKKTSKNNKYKSREINRIN